VDEKWGKRAECQTRTLSPVFLVSAHVETGQLSARRLVLSPNWHIEVISARRDIAIQQDKPAKTLIST